MATELPVWILLRDSESQEVTKHRIRATFNNLGFLQRYNETDMEEITQQPSGNDLARSIRDHVGKALDAHRNGDLNKAMQNILEAQKRAPITLEAAEWLLTEVTGHQSLPPKWTENPLLVDDELGDMYCLPIEQFTAHNFGLLHPLAHIAGPETYSFADDDSIYTEERSRPQQLLTKDNPADIVKIYEKLLPQFTVLARRFDTEIVASFGGAISTDGDNVSQLDRRTIAAQNLDGIDWSGADIAKLQELRQSSGDVRMGGIAPYALDYQNNGWKVTEDTLTVDDRATLAGSVVLAKMYPEARLDALCDDYNTTAPGREDFTGEFPQEASTNLLDSTEKMLRAAGAIAPNAVEGVRYRMVSEASRVEGAAKLLQRLCEQENIKIEVKKKDILLIGAGDELTTRGATPEAQCKEPKPLDSNLKDYLAKIRIGSLNVPVTPGKPITEYPPEEITWSCEALDAAKFVEQGSENATFIEIVPEILQFQQQRTQAIGLALGLHANQLHTLVIDTSRHPDEIKKTIMTTLRTPATRSVVTTGITRTITPGKAPHGSEHSKHRQLGRQQL